MEVEVVDDHDEALEIIHQAIRSKKLSFDSNLMIHFDAHPDLSLPRSLRSSDIFNPKVLYDHLSSSEGGISEWIIPLIFAEHLKTVWWVRPEWTKHIDDGHYDISVGAIIPTAQEIAEEDGVDVGFKKEASQKEEKRLRVCSTMQYFVEDTWCIAPVSRMDPAIPFKVLVSPASMSSVLSSTQLKALSTNHRSWILDICLDYFGSYNPFAFKLEKLNNTCELSNALQTAFSCAELDNLNISIQLENTKVLQAGLTRVLKFPEWIFEDRSDISLIKLMNLYKSPKHALSILENLALCTKNATSSMVDSALEMLPCATLPHSPGTPSESYLMLKTMEQFLDRPELRELGPPSLVSVARSSRDPYTPPERARWLETLVLEAVYKLYSTPGTCERNKKRPRIRSVDPVDGSDNENQKTFLLPMIEEKNYSDNSNQTQTFKYTSSLFGIHSDNDAIVFNTPSHLLSDFSEIWASTGGIEVGINSEGHRWKFEEGMLQGSLVSWCCSGSTRSLPNNGTDFRSCIGNKGVEYTVKSGERVRSILPGIVFAIFRDGPSTSGSTILVSHSVEKLEDTDGVVYRLNFNETHLHVKSWPAGYRLLTAYSQIDPIEGLEVGAVVSHTSILGYLSAINTPHLHLSVIWYEETTTSSPDSWEQFKLTGNFFFAESPTPVGYSNSTFIRE